VIEREPTLAGHSSGSGPDRAVDDKAERSVYYFFPRPASNLLKIKGIVDGFRNPTAAVSTT
jgi:hypothetical protein